MIPLRLHNPTVGLIPTTPLAEEGQTMEPLVSVPMASAEKFADTPAPEPELDPHGFRSNAQGEITWVNQAWASQLKAAAGDPWTPR